MKKIALTLLAPLLVALVCMAQSPLANFPPGVFDNRAALDPPAINNLVSPLLALSNNGAPSLSAINYTPLVSGISGTWNSATNRAANILPNGGTFSNLYVAPLPAVSLPALAGAAITTAEPDPIFAAIEAHRWRAEAIERLDRESDFDEAQYSKDDAARDLLHIEPTTVAAPPRCSITTSIRRQAIAYVGAWLKQSVAACPALYVRR